LWAVRGAAIVTLLLFYVPSPPWEWLENPFPLFLIVPFSILFLAILWRLRKTPYKDGLALAMAVGGVFFLLAGLGVFTALGDARPDWNWVGFFGLFALAQAILVGGALATYKVLGYAKGDWTLFATTSEPEMSREDRMGRARRVDRVAPRGRSFYMDATGVIHATSEDRDATLQDPIVQ
jgi:hypothetical protein